MSDTPNTGDRVRIEWPDGSAVEGGVTAEGCVLVPGGFSHGGERPDRLAQDNAFGDGRRVTVLERAKPTLPTERGSLVLAHTYDNEERRTFMRRANAQWGDGLLVYGDEELIDPVPVTAIPTADLTALLALANTRGVGDAAIAEAAVALCEQNGVTA